VTGEEKARTAEDLGLPGGDFRLFVSKLGFQALIALGILENPVTKSTEANIDHARMVIDDLRMLRDRTKGNLSPDEESHLTKVLSDLQFHFVRVSGAGGDESDGGATKAPNGAPKIDERD